MASDDSPAGSWHIDGRRCSVALLLVLAGIFGMHVLSAEDGAGGHGALPMVGTAHTRGPRDAT